MSRLFCLGVLIAFCLASNCHATDSASSQTPGGAGAAEEVSEKTKKARDIYIHSIIGHGKLSAAANGINTVYREKLLLMLSAEGSATSIGKRVKTIKNILDKSPGNHEIQNIYENANQISKQAERLMNSAMASSETVGKMTKALNEANNAARVEIQKLKKIARKRKLVTDDNADEVQQTAKAALQLIGKAKAIFDATKDKYAPEFKAITTATETIKQLESTAKEALRSAVDAQNGKTENKKDAPETPNVSQKTPE